MQKNTILHLPEIKDSATILVDASFLIEAVENPGLQKLVSDWQSRECVLLTLPEVAQEFTRGMSSNLEQYVKAEKFIDEMGITITDFRRVMNDEMKLGDRIFSYCFAVQAQKASVTDYKLCLELFHYPDMLLISGNTRDVPLKFFSEIDVIAINKMTSIHSEYIFQFNSTEYYKYSSRVAHRFMSRKIPSLI